MCFGIYKRKCDTRLLSVRQKFDPRVEPPPQHCTRAQPSTHLKHETKDCNPVFGDQIVNFSHYNAIFNI